MNTNNVVSLPAAVDLTGKEHYCVKMTGTGVNVAGSGDSANIIGTLHRAMPKQEDGVYLGDAVSVFRRYAGIHYAVMGASSAAVTPGTTLSLDTVAANAGKLVTGGTAVAVALDTFTAADGAIVNVMFI